jgi:hypothetical protein
VAALFLVPFFAASVLFVPVAVALRGLQRPGGVAQAPPEPMAIPADLVTAHAVEVDGQHEVEQAQELEVLEPDRA